jgi:predicted nucleic acid-binding protein
VANGDGIAIAPQVVAEFIHVASDSRRFAQPLDVNTARQLAIQWWTARDVARVYPDDPAVIRFLDWLQVHALGRKRLLDTLLAATYESAGISSLLTTNARDFSVFGCFQCVAPGSI